MNSDLWHILAEAPLNIPIWAVALWALIFLVAFACLGGSNQKP